METLAGGYCYIGKRDAAVGLEATNLLEKSQQPLYHMVVTAC
jgi:hypothetical protein